MEKSAGRKERRRLARNNRRGRIKSIINEVEQGGHDAILKMKRNPAAMKAWSKRV